MRRTLVVCVLFFAVTSLACKDMFQIRRGCVQGSGDNLSPTPSESQPCSGSAFYESFYPPVFHKFFFEDWSEDSLLDVALTSETVPPRGSYILILGPNEPPTVTYHVTLRMAQTPEDPSLMAEVSAWTGLRSDGLPDADSLGEVTIRNGQSINFPSYSGGKKYAVGSSFKWIVFKAQKRSEVVNSKKSGQKSAGAIYVDFNW